MLLKDVAVFFLRNIFRMVEEAGVVDILSFSVYLLRFQERDMRIYASRIELGE